jgi:hypothetical protein
MGTTSAIHRTTISESEILGVIETLHHAQINGEGINPDSLSFLKKLRMLAFKINLGVASPAYIATGSRKQSFASLVSLEALGASAEEKLDAAIAGTIGKYNNSAELSAEQEDELSRLEREMLEGLVAEGNTNVILEERRSEVRSIEEKAIDEALFKSL